MALLYLVRHGQASFGTDNYDRLSASGLRQARLVGRYLQQVAPPVSLLVSGSHVRHRETVAALASSLSPSNGRGDQNSIDERFNEIQIDAQFELILPQLIDSDGALATLVEQSKRSSRAYQQVLRKVFLHWQKLVDLPPGMESWNKFCARVRCAIGEVRHNCPPSHSVIVITSAGVIARVVQEVLGSSRESAYSLFEAMMNCSITRLLHNRKRLSLATFNECSYLLSDVNGGDPSLLTYR